MTQPENFTAAQASDPQTPGQVLADIAALRPDLRVAVASNPSTYPGLLEWLGSLGEPAVDAAIAARRAAIQQTQQMPTLPPTAPPAPSWAGQPAAQAPAPMVTPGYPGMPPQGGAPGLQYAGMPPQGGLQYGAPPPKKSNTALWIILGVVGLIILIVIVLVIFVFNRAKDVVENNLDHITNNLGQGDNYGDNATLDALWDACAAENWASCDQLYFDSPLGSAYESFGDTCGNRTDGNQLCVDELGGGAVPSEPNAYGDDPTLDALWDACTAENWQACDDLYMQSGFGTDYEAYGDTCGNRTDGSADCVVATTGTTSEAGLEYPTYAEYLATLPPGTETCGSQGEISDMGDGTVSIGGPDASISMVDGQMVVFCPGAKLVVGESFSGVNQNGEPLERGALFSVDPDGSFVQLSSF